ncbi:unnamed protein product [Cylindrotheca closterium]|uniref:RNA helicase n=1 Tax=Cylindrotheca closterium TaxID=2856 RepID=A0AAD2FSG2_9STRA|nr:unnamed protein product [Cylindrotheca closterium]
MQKNNRKKKSDGDLSSKQSVNKSFLLSGLPKDASLSEIKAFLPTWMTKSKHLDTRLDNLHRLQRSSTAHMHTLNALPNEKYRDLCNFFVKQRFRDEYIVTIGPLRVKTSNGKKLKQKIDSVCFARQFWDFMTRSEEIYICNRHDMSKHFMNFCRSNGDNSMNANDKQWKARLSQTVKTMQKMKLMKSTPSNNFIVMAMFANPDNLQFPEKELIHEKTSNMMRQLEHDMCNKNGVTVSNLPVRIMGAIGDKEKIQFHLTADPPRKLHSVEVSGPNGGMFQIDETEGHPTIQSPSVEPPISITMSVRPHKLGILRAKVTFTFEDDNGRSFDIARVVTMSCGYRSLNEALKPTAPYQRPSRRRLENVHYDKTNIVGPPKETIEDRTGGGGPSPFMHLAQYPIPSEVAESIKANNYHQSMDRIGWRISPNHESIKHYGEYWKHLLYASECQMQRDVQYFDMVDTSLSKEERYFVLRVPGLSEGRPSVLRGDIVNITFKGVLYKGRVVSIRQYEVLMDLHSRFDQNFNCASDRVSVHFTFSRMSLRTSHKVLDYLAESQLGAPILVPTNKHVAHNREANRKHGQSDVKDVHLAPWANDSLNLEQQAAVQRIVNGHLRPMPYIIFGPPGTGKTTTVVEAIYQLGKQDKKIVLLAPSNDAADVLAGRLASYFPPTKLRRILAYSRSIESLPTNIQCYASDSLGPEAQAREIKSAQIVVGTVNLASRFSYWGIPRGYFDVLCVDEAGHATEPEVTAAAASLMDFYGKEGAVGQLILAGDPKQLGPISNSDICRKYGLTMSLMERLTEREVYGRQADGKYPENLLTKLVRNYRSHPSILKLPNEMFYSDLQACGDSTVTMNMANWEHLPKSGFPVVFHAVDGENLREGSSPSWFNPTEAQQVVEYVSLLTRESNPPIPAQEIGIITPYSRQAQKIRLALEIENMPEIKVGSVESFQGQERRVIILSTVRAEQEIVSHDLRHSLGFVAHPKRFNVAITRAKALLLVIGCPSVLALDKANWLPFMKYCYENGGWAGESWDPSMAEDDIMVSMGMMSPDDNNNDLNTACLSPVALEEGLKVFHEEV